MLILTVQEGDYIMIDDDIRIEFSPGIGGNSVRLGIDAPRTRKVARGKVYEKMMLENPDITQEQRTAIEEQQVKARLAERNRNIKKIRAERARKMNAVATV